MNKLNLMLIGLLFALAGCVEDDGPFEQAGEEIDEAVEDVQTQGEDPLNQIDDALDEAADEAEDALQ